MNIVMTGATSFSGMWFAKELAKVASLTTLIHQPKEAYSGLRQQRLEHVEKVSTPIVAGPFGSEIFLEQLHKLPHFDLFCHHAAEVTHYKSSDFDPYAALKKNTASLPEVLKCLKNKGCHSLILTGSIFEPHEGKGSDNLRAVSSYGLSKGLTSTFFEYHCQLAGIELKKFVIPNPFGPFEEVRYTTFLAKTWLEGKIAPVTHPDYSRDNIPISLLAKAYSYFAGSDLSKFNPSFYVGSQKNFTLLFQKEIRNRLQLPCDIDFKVQTDFTEPLERINLDRLEPAFFNWDEEKSWDELAEFYLRHYGK